MYLAAFDNDYWLVRPPKKFAASKLAPARAVFDLSVTLQYKMVNY